MKQMRAPRTAGSGARAHTKNSCGVESNVTDCSSWTIPSSLRGWCGNGDGDRT